METLKFLNQKLFIFSFLSLSIFLICTSSGVAGEVPTYPLTLPEDWQTVFRNADNCFYHGDGFTTEPNVSNGASLAWNESPLLSSYIRMYETYRDPYYLRKVVTHFDRVVKTLKYWTWKDDQSGQILKNWDFNSLHYDWEAPPAWWTANYTNQVVANGNFTDLGFGPRNFIVNSGFEDPDSMSNLSLPKGWYRPSSNSQEIVYRSTNVGDFSNGVAGLVAKSNGLLPRAQLTQDLPVYIPGAVYQVTLRGKTNFTTANPIYGRVGIYYPLGTATGVLADQLFSNQIWGDIKFDIQAPLVPGRLLKIYCYPADYKKFNGIVNFDDVQWTGLGEPAAVNPNSGLEEAGVDLSLPAGGWSRMGSLLNTYVYRSTLPEDRHSGLAGLVTKTGDNRWNVAIQSLRDFYVPNQRYNLSFWAKTNGKVQGRVEVYDASGNRLAAKLFSNTQWTLLNVTFMAPADANTNLRAYYYVGDWKIIDGKVCYDDIKLSAFDSNYAANWQAVNGLANTVQRIGTDPCTLDNPCLKVTANGSTAMTPAAEQSNLSYVSGASYVASVKVKGGGTLEIWDWDGDLNHNPIKLVEPVSSKNNGAWENLSLTFTAPASGHTLKMHLSLKENTLGTSAIFDDASLKMETKYLVHNALIVKPILRFIRLVREDPQLKVEFGAAADKYYELITRYILPSWEIYWRSTDSRGYYVSNNEVFMGQPGDTADFSLPHNQYLPMAEIFLDLWKLTGDDVYKIKAAKLGQTFKDFLRPVNLANGKIAYNWHYSDDLSKPTEYGTSVAEDISHANLDVSAILRLAEENVVFTASDIEKMANTFLQVVWNGSLTKPIVMHSLVDGQDITNASAYIYEMWGWIGLAKFNKSVWSLIDELYKGIKLSSATSLPLTLSGLAKYDNILSATTLDGTAPVYTQFEIAPPLTGDSYTVSLSYGDGVTFTQSAVNSLISVSHLYTKAGIYTAKLNLTNTAGQIITRSLAITVLENKNLSWTAYSQAPNFTKWETTGGWDNNSQRILIKGNLIAKSGTKMRLRFKGVKAYTVQKVSVVQREGATLNAVDSTFAQVTFGGGTWESGGNVPANGVLYSDWIPFTVTSGKDIFVTLWYPSASGIMTYLYPTAEASAWMGSKDVDIASSIDWEGQHISMISQIVPTVEIMEVSN